MRRWDLTPDCGSCAALCCVATSFEASEDFACAKAAGERCAYLRGNGRCSIHAELAIRGFGGCAAYECYGAGPRVTRDFGGSHAAFLVLRVVHELLWQLTEAAKLCPASCVELRAAMAAEVAALDALSALGAAAEPEIPARRALARGLLRRVGEAVRPLRRASS